MASFQTDLDRAIERLLDHLNLFAVVMWFLGYYYCKSLGAKSTELWENPFLLVNKRDEPPEEKLNRYGNRV